LFGEANPFDSYREREVSSGCERGIDIDEVDRASEFFKQSGEDVLLVAPNQTVPPIRRTAGIEEVEGPLALLG
jgi:hypothetical protein